MSRIHKPSPRAIVYPDRDGNTPKPRTTTFLRSTSTTTEV
jgi:hypothetical protein